MINMENAEENLEPATVTLIAYRGIGLQPPRSKKKSESKKAKWKVLFCHGQDKKMSTMEIISQDGNPVWDTTATIPVGNSYEPLVLLLHYRDAPVGQVIIPWTQVPDKATAVGQPERLGELEAVRKNPEPSGGLYYNCWIETYRPVSQQPRKPPGLLKRLSLSRSKLSASSASIAEDSRRQDGTLEQQPEQQQAASSRKATVPTVKKLKRRLFNRGGKSSGKDAVDSNGPVSKAVSMGNLSGSSSLSAAPLQTQQQQQQPSSSAAYSPSPS
uniref:C2 domain-containing protein n=1 Tax=Macrostomum lignano TaxID=282301 RepID=A0A1I8GW21_9PLAT